LHEYISTRRLSELEINLGVFVDHVGEESVRPSGSKDRKAKSSDWNVEGKKRFLFFSFKF